MLMTILSMNPIKRKVHALKRQFSDSLVMHNYKEYLEKNEETGDPKRALVSYLSYPLLKPYKKVSFSNSGIARSIPRALNELGYIVDIVDLHNMKFVPQRKYDLFLGHAGHNFKKIRENLDKNSVAIVFAPGDYWKFANENEKKRFEYLKQRRGVVLPYDRYHYGFEMEEFSFSIADGIICLGNETMLEPYSKFPLVLNLNNASYYDNHFDKTEKDIEKTRNNYLFFSGGGNVHKGLDLLLEVFSRRNENLYICTTLDQEFGYEYKKELQRSNIHFMGWVRQRSKKFYDIVDNCSFIIFPSCSEGSAGSVVECINQGLIPIISEETRIDVHNMGILLKESTIEEIEKAVEKVSNKPLDWIKEKSDVARKIAVTDYSEKAFVENMKMNIETIIRAKKENILLNSSFSASLTENKYIGMEE